VIKYFLFAITALPIFIYCLQNVNGTGKKLKWPYFILAYIVLLAAIQFSSDSLRSSKLVYSICPLVLFLGSFLLNPRIKAVALRIGVFLGFISYSLYIIHRPVQNFMSLYIGNMNGIFIVILILIIIIPLAYVLEIMSGKLFRKSRKPDRSSLLFPSQSADHPIQGAGYDK
jgi:peptidoglycan/LPS O-acetylase OafA/YrhL